MYISDAKRKSAAHNYFPMPNQIFNLGLSAEEIATYAYLMFRENRKTYTCYPSFQTIGDGIGKSKNSVMKYVRGLEEKHLIYTEYTQVWGKGGKLRNGNLLYTIRPIQEAVEHNVAEQFEAMKMAEFPVTNVLQE